MWGQIELKKVVLKLKATEICHLMCIIHFYVQYAFDIEKKVFWPWLYVFIYLSERTKEVIELTGANELLSGWPHLFILFDRQSVVFLFLKSEDYLC